MARRLKDAFASQIVLSVLACPFHTRSLIQCLSHEHTHTHAHTSTRTRLVRSGDQSSRTSGEATPEVEATPSKHTRASLPPVCALQKSDKKLAAYIEQRLGERNREEREREREREREEITRVEKLNARGECEMQMRKDRPHERERNTGEGYAPFSSMALALLPVEGAHELSM